MPQRRHPVAFLQPAGSGFVAGFVSTLVFHQIALAILWSVGVAPFPPYAMSATPPLGVPAVISLAFWGGVWGVLFVAAAAHLPTGGGYWLSAALLGAVLPTLVALFVVMPIKGLPFAADWNVSVWATGLIVNAAWGLGTGCLLRPSERLLGARAAR